MLSFCSASETGAIDGPVSYCVHESSRSNENRQNRNSHETSDAIRPSAAQLATFAAVYEASATPGFVPSLRDASVELVAEKCHPTDMSS